MPKNRVQCPACNGMGQFIVIVEKGTPKNPAGKVRWDPCRMCNGKGQIFF